MKSGARRLTSPRRLPGSRATTDASSGNCQRAACAAPVGLQRHLVRQRMTDEFGPDRVARVERRLEGQQAQHQVAGARDATDPPLAPRPDLRAHVLHGLDARRAQPRAQAEVELGRVDTDEDVGPPGREFAAQAAAQPQQPRQVPEHFRKAHDREFMRVGERLATRGPHGRSAHPTHGKARATRAQLSDQRRPELVARSLAGHDRHPDCAVHVSG